MRLYLHHLPGLGIIRDNVADPFDAGPNGTAVLRDQVVASGIELCGSLEEADVAALPAHWAIYPTDRRGELEEFIAAAGALDRHVMIWFNGDNEADLPWRNVIRFQHATRTSRRQPGPVRIYPAFIEDLVAEVFDNELATRGRGERPVVGFCGQAETSPLDELKRLGFKAHARVRHHLLGSEWVPEPWSSHVRLRRRALAALQGDSRIDTDFVIRKQYRAGVLDRAVQRELTHPTAMEFYDSIQRTHFTLAVRGGGNFSVRLYETLCLGRVPLHVQTDSALPWPDHPFWRDVMVTVDRHDLSRLGSATASRFAEWDEDAWQQVQLDARRFWADRLSFQGYFSHFREALEPNQGN